MSLENEPKEQPSIRLVSKSNAESAQQTPIKRQFVNFTFYRVRPEWRMLDEATRKQSKQEFQEVIESCRKDILMHYYSLVGLRKNAEMMIWRIGYSLDPLQEMTAKLNNTKLGQYLEVTESFLSMTKRSMYIDRLNPEHDEDRLHIIPGKSKYLFVYPFVKTRDWYMSSQETRQEMMDEHIRIGTKYRSVKLHTTYSFGLDDQEFVVAFETDEPTDFLDLVEELRFTKASKYTLRDTPMFSCRQRTIEECLDALG
jgi:chlorite dismutase